MPIERKHIMAKTIVELKQNRDLLLKEAEGILDDIDSGDRNMSADEKARYDAAVTGVSELNESITLRMKLETVAAPTFAQASPAEPKQDGSIRGCPPQSRPCII